MLRRFVIVAAAALLVSPSVSAQGGNPMTQSIKAQFEEIKMYLSRTAQKVPEDLYSFKATPEVRSLGQIIGHVADSNVMICSVAAGEKPPQSGFEKGKTSKADLAKGLIDSIAYCDKVIASMDDKKGMETVKFFNYMVQDNRSFLEMFSSNYTFVNDRLARHYGIPEVGGDEFRKVQYPDDSRRGILGHRRQPPGSVGRHRHMVLLVG